MRRKFSNPPPEPVQPEVKGQIVARRALEIALAGHHTIGLIGARGSGRHFLAEAFPDAKARVFDTCPCGQRGSAATLCQCTDAARSVYYAVIAPELAEIDILVEVVPMPLKYWEAPGMSLQDWADFDARVNSTRERSVHVSTLDIADDAARRTRELAVRKLSLSCQQYAALMRVSRTIATMDHAKGIAAKHIAEAAQYIFPALPHHWSTN